jgi:anti-sigma28 factor (negative regulator of flagellin synthesis)
MREEQSFRSQLELNNDIEKRELEGVDDYKKMSPFSNQNNPEYNWPAFAKEILDNEKNIHDDLENYCSDDITISFIENKGRGVIALNDIPAGSLLVVSKALVCEFGDEPREFGKKDHSHVGIKRELQRHIASNPSIIPNLCAIYDGTTDTSKLLPRIVNNLPFVDIKEKEFDTKRIDKIIALNSFSLRGVFESQEREDKDYGAAFHLLPAFFNHALHPNCTYFTAGDMLIMRSNKGIKAGDEVTISYIGDQEEAERKNALKKHGEFLILEEEAEMQKYDPENELEMKVKMLKEKCKDGKRNRELCDEILSTGRLHPHESLATYYLRLSTQYYEILDTKNGLKWSNTALSAYNRHADEILGSLTLNFLLEDMNEAERLSDLMFGPNCWEHIKDSLERRYIQ